MAQEWEMHCSLASPFRLGDKCILFKIVKEKQQNKSMPLEHMAWGKFSWYKYQSKKTLFMCWERGSW